MIQLKAMFRNCDFKVVNAKFISSECIRVDDVPKTWNVRSILRDACLEGNMYIATIAVTRGGIDWGYGFREACTGGHIGMVNFIIKQGVNWNEGLCGACEGGHIDLAMLMIEHGANEWNDGLRGACEGGHHDLVTLMIEKGAYGWNKGLEYACEEGHIDLVRLMIERGATNLNEGLYYASKRGDYYKGRNRNIEKLLIEKGAERI